MGERIGRGILPSINEECKKIPEKFSENPSIRTF
jgi:hypothetical protein